MSVAPLPASPSPSRIEDYALSVLLHDIGKFWERSSEAPTPSPAELHLFCPRVGEAGTHLHSHSALSSRFIQEWVGIEGAERWAPRHHLPDEGSREEICAQLGDLLAHGAGEPDESRDAPGAAAAPLVSLLRESGPRFLPFVRLGAGADAVFPRASVPLSREDYRFHWNHFVQAIEKAAPRSDIDAWLGLLEEFAARIPAGSTSRQLRAIAEIDLFTHSRLVAAIAVAIYRGPLPLPRLLALRAALTSPRPEEPEDVFSSLVVGEIAGRREFLESPPDGDDGRVQSLSRRAGRLRDLTRLAARAIARGWELPTTSILWVENGRFCLLAPAGADAAALCGSLAALCEAEAGAGLDVVAAGAGLTLGDFRSGLATAWMRLDESLRQAKRERIARRAKSDYDGIFASGSPPISPVAPPEPVAAAEPVSPEEGGGWPSRRLTALCVTIEGREHACREALAGPGRSLARELILRAEIERFLDRAGPADLARREPDRFVHFSLEGDEVLLASGIDAAVEAFVALRESFRRAVDRPGLVLAGGLAWGPAYRRPWAIVEEARALRASAGGGMRRTSAVSGDRIALGGRTFDAQEAASLRAIARDVARGGLARPLGGLTARRWLTQPSAAAEVHAALHSIGRIPTPEAARTTAWLFEQGKENMANLPLVLDWAEEIEGDSKDGNERAA